MMGKKANSESRLNKFKSPFCYNSLGEFRKVEVFFTVITTTK